MRSTLLFHDRLVDGNLRAVVAEDVTFEHDLLFLPRADGIVPGAYADKNDWAVLDTWLCRHTASAEGLAPAPVVACW